MGKLESRISMWVLLAELHRRVICCRQKECSSGFSAVVCGIGFVDSLVEWVMGIGMGKGGGR